MRIALVAPVALPVPPPDYGGTERVVASLALALQRRGHVVKVFAAAGSDPDLPLASPVTSPVSERLRGDYARAETRHWRQALQAAGWFDILHDHTKQRGLQLAQESPIPIVSTLHNPVTPARDAAYRRAPDHPWVAISHAQARQYPHLHLAGVVHHGIDVDAYPLGDTKDDYLLYLGRIAPDKGVHHAIDVARQAKRPLIIAGPVAVGSETYYREQIAPAIDGRRVRHVGPVGGSHKLDLLRRASALLFPSVWEEPFGLVIIEALACGTPVLALKRGAVPEILTDRSVGRAVVWPQDLAEALPEVLWCAPRACREHVRRHFSLDEMARGYEAVYQGLLVTVDRPVA
jgi:glycosyltransferase involved in cell wall biosynthesis